MMKVYQFFYIFLVELRNSDSCCFCMHEILMFLICACPSRFPPLASLISTSLLGKLAVIFYKTYNLHIRTVLPVHTLCMRTVRFFSTGIQNPCCNYQAFLQILGHSWLERHSRAYYTLNSTISLVSSKRKLSLVLKQSIRRLPPTLTRLRAYSVVSIVLCFILLYFDCVTYSFIECKDTTNFSYCSNPYYEKTYCQVRFNIWAQKKPPMRHAPGAFRVHLITL